jgi:hypothetical protein
VNYREVRKQKTKDAKVMSMFALRCRRTASRSLCSVVGKQETNLSRGVFKAFAGPVMMLYGLRQDIPVTFGFGRREIYQVHRLAHSSGVG